MSDLAQRYLACWNETDAGARRALLEQVWSPDATYTDPLAQAQGVSAIDATIAAVQGQFPGLVFTPVGEVDSHHQQARFGWGLGPVDAEPIVIGFDVVVTGDDGRIANVYGFLDQVPA
jgi:hypothetical protein